MADPRIGLTLTLSAMLLLCSPIAGAATFTVTKGDDTNDGICDADCSLREAVIAANGSPGADDITVPAGTYVLDLLGADEDASATGDLDITNDLTLTGAGPGLTILDGNGTDRVIDVLSGTVEISAVTIQNGRSGISNGGTLTVINSTISGNTLGIYSIGGVTTVTNSTISGNTSTGISNRAIGTGTLTVTNSTISGNSGGISNRGFLTVINSTISGNSFSGIDTFQSFGGDIGIATVTNSTITRNGFHGIRHSGVLTVANTIVAINSPNNCQGQEANSNGNNLDDDGSCEFTQPSDLSNVADAGLGLLANNGGPTETHALLLDSPSIDAADPNSCPLLDQRGQPRADGDGDSLVVCDIGAFEASEGPCGNGILNLGDECDDGNPTAGDGCNASCQCDGCGDGQPNLNAQCEECDDGNIINGDGCDSDCAIEFCGDGVVNDAPNEQCDDGNNINGDGCDSDCAIEFCGDGVVNDAPNEQCDDGNLTAGDGCNASCQCDGCGDGQLNPNAQCEECDDGNLTAGDGCNASCQCDGICGDGQLNPNAQCEECDDGNTIESDGCTNDCTICGNGVLTPPEQCDDGNDIEGDGCSGSCRSQAQSKDQQRCINSLNKNLAKVAKAQGKHICKCIKRGAKEDLVGSIEDCVNDTNTFGNDKVQKAKQKTLDKAVAKCPVPPNFGATDPNTVNQAAMDKELSLIHQLFGSDLDAAVVLQKDPNTANARSTSKCQIDVAKQAKKCQDAKLKAFNRCKKDGLRGRLLSLRGWSRELRKSPPGLIDSAQDLRDLCLGVGSAPQPDPKGRIAKTCGTKLAKKIAKKCSGVDLGVAFPPFDPSTDGTLQNFVDGRVECEVCLALNEVDGLDRDCDLFDDGEANGSCP